MEYRITDNRGSLIAEASGDDALNLALETLAGETPSTHFATLFLVEAYDGAAVQPIRWYVYAAAGHPDTKGTRLGSGFTGVDAAGVAPAE